MGRKQPADTLATHEPTQKKTTRKKTTKRKKKVNRSTKCVECGASIFSDSTYCFACGKKQPLKPIGELREYITSTLKAKQNVASRTQAKLDDAESHDDRKHFEKQLEAQLAVVNKWKSWLKALNEVM